MQISTVRSPPTPAFSLTDVGAFGTRVRAAALGTALELLDQLGAHHAGTVMHSVQVARLTLVMWAAAPAWLGPYETVMLSGLLHDVGKLFIPRDILASTHTLTDAEFAVMREHPGRGAMLLEQLGFSDEVVAAARDHHERWSGNGYPSGRAARLLPPLSRAVATADAFSAMIGPRPYRRTLTIQQALAELTACRGTQFDPTTVDLLHAGMEVGDVAAAITPATGPNPEIARAVQSIGMSWRRAVPPSSPVAREGGS